VNAVKRAVWPLRRLQPRPVAAGRNNAQAGRWPSNSDVEEHAARSGPGAGGSGYAPSRAPAADAKRLGAQYWNRQRDRVISAFHAGAGNRSRFDLPQAIGTRIRASVVAMGREDCPFIVLVVPAMLGVVALTAVAVLPH